MVETPVGHRIIPRTTPLHVYELVTQLLRITLTDISEKADYPFKYTEDVATTGVFIDTAYSKETGVYGKKPVVILSRGAISSQPIGLGDTAEINFDKTNKNGTAFVTSSVHVTTIARSSAEVDILSNEIYNFLIACRTVLPALTGIQRVNSISMSPVVPYEDDAHMFSTQASIDYIMQYKWTWSLASVLLREIGLHLEHVNDTRILDLSE